MIMDYQGRYFYFLSTAIIVYGNIIIHSLFKLDKNIPIQLRPSALDKPHLSAPYYEETDCFEYCASIRRLVSTPDSAIKTHQTYNYF